MSNYELEHFQIGGHTLNVVDQTAREMIDGLQPKTDSSLTTTAKTVVGAINELDSDLSYLTDDIITLQGSVSGQSVPANTNLDLLIPIDVPNGYEIVGSGGYYVDNHVINISGTRLTGSNSIIICSRNMSSINYGDITYYARVICKKITN